MIRQRNIGADLLRIIACYMVVSIHFGSTLPCADFAVPCFFALSFVFLSLNLSVNELNKRLLRLYIPFAFWGCAGFVMRCLRDHSLQFRYLVMQLFFGQTCNLMLWFVSVLMIVTIFMVALQKINLCGYWWALGMVFLLSFVFEFVGLNFRFCSKLPSAMSMTVGRIVEMLPYAVLGIVIVKCGERWLSGRIALVVAGSLFLCGLVLRVFGVEIPYQGFGYGGVVRFVGVAGVVILFVCVLRRFAYCFDNMRCIINHMAGCTAGVYYMHKLVGESIRRFLWEGDDIFLTAIVVGSSYLLVLLMRRCGLGLLVK